jgi:hypothetical protein
MPVVLAFRRLRQEDHNCKASLGYLERPSLTSSPTNKTNENKEAAYF